MNEPEESSLLMIFTLPAVLKRRWEELKDQSSLWEDIGRGIIVWSINEFINSPVDRVLIDSLKEFHRRFIAHTYAALSEVPKGYWVKSSKWTKDDVQITLSNQRRAIVPFFDRIESIEPVLVKRYPKRGILLTELVTTGNVNVTATTMPGHFLPTMYTQLQHRHYNNPAFQTDFDNNPETTFESLYLTLRNEDFADDLNFAFGQFLNGATALIKTLNPSLPTPVESTEQKSKTWVGKPQRVSVEGRFFKSPGKAANDKRIPIQQVYTRLYSNLPQWKAWYFIGTKKDPDCH